VKEEGDDGVLRFVRHRRRLLEEVEKRHPTTSCPRHPRCRQPLCNSGVSTLSRGRPPCRHRRLHWRRGRARRWQSAAEQEYTLHCDSLAPGPPRFASPMLGFLSAAPCFHPPSMRIGGRGEEEAAGWGTNGGGWLGR
jgi:hypothetical protein